MAENFILLLFLILPPVLFAVSRTFFRKVRPSIKERKTLSLVIGNLLILLFLLSVVVLSGEVYFRFFYDSTDSFGLCKTTERWFERHFERNQSGFRDSYNYLPQVEPGKRRISFVGDSFTVGHGIPDVEDRFANLVRSQRPYDEVHVLAECGLDTGRELELMQFLPSSGYETDIVVLAYCLNDISDIVPEWQQVLNRIYEGPKPGFFATHSYLFNTLNARLRMAREPDIVDYYSFVRNAYQGPVWNRHSGRLESFRDAVVESGGELFVVTFPFLHAVGDDYGYHDIHRRLDDFWSDMNVPHLDLLEVYDGESPDQLVVSSRDAHPNEKAHAMAARAITAFIDEQMNQ
ncbi:MAG: SGNH/GDSL hydrolase family protein [Planctomycetaceae bacterium]